MLIIIILLKEVGQTVVDKNALERALLINVVRKQAWDTLVTNGITEEHFTHANKELFKFIQDYTKRKEYPDIQLLQYHFQIDDNSIQEYIQISDIPGLCKELNIEYLKEVLLYKLSQLNEHNNEISTDPKQFIDRFGETYNELKILGYESKTVNLFQDIQKALEIDRNNTISTGFKELDEQITGWRRGEDLIVFMARPGQGKSWFALKFGLHAALNGERVGLYSGEMGQETLQDRVLCCAKQDYTSTLKEASDFIQEKQPYISVLTAGNLRRKANVNDLEAMIVRDKLTMLIVDQLSLMEDINKSSALQARHHYGNITMDLLDLSIKYDIPVILMVQSNRAGADSNVSPEL